MQGWSKVALFRILPQISRTFKTYVILPRSPFQ